jgi:hypothetical protein
MPRKQEIAKDYIEDNILNKDLLEIQESLSDLKNVVSSKEKDKENKGAF